MDGKKERSQKKESDEREGVNEETRMDGNIKRSVLNICIVKKSK